MFEELQKEVQQQSDPVRAVAVARFFKTGKGEYGEGDTFVGLTVPQCRLIARQYASLSFSDTTKLLRSKVHEERMIALLILISQYKKGDCATKKKIFDLYLGSTKYINNWDLIDLSAEYIVGEYLFVTQKGKKRDISLLKKLAHSESVWERRIAMLSTFQFIKNGSSSETFEIADILIADRHDLIQKAVGWLLREVGKRVSEEEEKEFLKKRYKIMPRTMLRYAIERFPEEERQRYLRGEV